MISKTFRSPRQEQTCVNAVNWWCPDKLWWSYPWNRDQVRDLPVLLSVTELFLSLTPTILSRLDIRAVRKIALWMQITDLKEADSGYEDCLQEDREIWWAGDFNSGGTSNIREEGACHLKREQNEIIKWGDVCLCVAITPGSLISAALGKCLGSLQHFPQMEPQVEGCKVDLAREILSKSHLWQIFKACKAFPHLWHISATPPPLGLKSSLLYFRFLIRPGRASEKLFSILQIASIMRLHLTCHFKGGLMVVLLKRHPFLTNKTDTLSKWDGVAKPDQFLWQLRVTILHFLQTCNQLSLNSFYLAYDMFFVQTHHPVCLRWV